MLINKKCNLFLLLQAQVLEQKTPKQQIKFVTNPYDEA